MGRLAGIIQHKYRFLIGEVGLAVNWICKFTTNDCMDEGGRAMQERLLRHEGHEVFTQDALKYIGFFMDRIMNFRSRPIAAGCSLAFIG